MAVISKRENKMNLLIIPARSLEISRPRPREDKPGREWRMLSYADRSAQLGGQGGQNSHRRAPGKRAPLQSAIRQEGMRKPAEAEEQGQPQARACLETVPVPTSRATSSQFTGKRETAQNNLMSAVGQSSHLTKTLLWCHLTEIQSKTGGIGPFLSSSNVS